MFAADTEKCSRLWSALKKGRRIAVLSHTHPDGDAVGCTVAAQSFLRDILGREADVILPDRWGCGMDFLASEANLLTASDEGAPEIICRADTILCLDFNTASRVASLEGALRSSDATKILIDHHPGPETGLFDIVFSETAISSACELLYWILLDNENIAGDPGKLPVLCAKALMTGMTTDTNNFANSIFPSTFRMASGLLEAGVDRDSILSSLYSSKRESVMRGWHRMLDRHLHITDEGAAYMILTKRTRAAFDLREGDTDGLVNVPLQIGRVRMSALLTEEDGFFRMSLRSKGEVNVGELARTSFHGGGHDCASGGRILCPEDIPAKKDAGAYFERITAQFLKK